MDPRNRFARFSLCLVCMRLSSVILLFLLVCNPKSETLRPPHSHRLTGLGKTRYDLSTAVQTKVLDELLGIDRVILAGVTAHGACCKRTTYLGRCVLFYHLIPLFSSLRPPFWGSLSAHLTAGICRWSARPARRAPLRSVIDRSPAPSSKKVGFVSACAPGVLAAC